MVLGDNSYLQSPIESLTKHNGSKMMPRMEEYHLDIKVLHKELEEADNKTKWLLDATADIKICTRCNLNG